MIRAKVRFTTQHEIKKFVEELNSDGSVDKFMLENFDGSIRVDARSFLGAIYMATENSDDVFLVNMSEDGKFPSHIDNFRY